MCWGGACSAWPTWLGVLYGLHDLPVLGCCMQCMTYLAWGVGGLTGVLGWCMTYLAWGVGVMYAVHDPPGLWCWRTYLGVGVVHDLPYLAWGVVCSAWPTWPGVLEDLLGCWGGAWPTWLWVLGWCMQCMAWGVGGFIWVLGWCITYLAWGDVCSAWPTWLGVLEDLLGCWGGGAWSTWLWVLVWCMQCMTYLAWGVGGLTWVLGWCMTYLALGVGVMYAVHDLPGLGCWRTYLGVGVVHDLCGLGCWGDVCSAWPTWPGVLEDLFGGWGGACSAWHTWLQVMDDVLGWCMQCITYLAWGVGWCVGVLHAVHDLPGLGCWGVACSAWPTWLGVLEDLFGCWGGACCARPTWLGVLDDIWVLGCCMQCMTYLPWGVGWLIWVLGWCMQCMTYLAWGVGGLTWVLGWCMQRMTYLAWGVGGLTWVLGWCMQCMTYLAWCAACSAYLPGLGCWRTYLGVGVVHAVHDIPGFRCWMMGWCMQCMTYLTWGAACSAWHTWPGALDNMLGWCVHCMTYLAWGVGWLVGVLHAVHDLPALGCWMTYLGVGVVHAVHDLPGLGCWGCCMECMGPEGICCCIWGSGRRSRSPLVMAPTRLVVSWGSEVWGWDPFWPETQRENGTVWNGLKSPSTAIVR